MTAAEVITAIRTARAAARATVWAHRPLVSATGPVVVDLDATLIGSHREKEGATPNFKRGFGFHPLLAFVDHGAGGTGEPLAGEPLRPGRANANTAADQIAVLDAALAQLPEPLRERVLVRGDSGSGVQALLWHVTNLGLAYSVGSLGASTRPGRLGRGAQAGLARRTQQPDGRRRDGAQVAELTRWMPATLTGWPPGMRLIARRERPHPGAQLHITDDDGWRITVFATNTIGGRIAELEVRHRLRARAEDRIRGLKDTGITNLPLQAFTKNQVWLELACLAYELLTWTQLLAFHDRPARAWEPKRLRLRLLSVAARLITTGRRRILRLLETMALGRPHHQRPPTARSTGLTPTHITYAKHQEEPPHSAGRTFTRRTPQPKPRATRPRLSSLTKESRLTLYHGVLVRVANWAPCVVAWNHANMHDTMLLCLRPFRFAT